MTGYKSKKAAARDKLDSMEREALKMALKVLEDLPGFRADIDNAITAIKEALAQPAQEPVAWMRPSEEGYDSAFRDHSTVMICTGNPWTGWIPLYTAPLAQPAQERNFCPRCGKRTADLTVIHTCTPPQESK
jgi:hypothetical protein